MFKQRMFLIPYDSLHTVMKSSFSWVLLIWRELIVMCAVQTLSLSPCLPCIRVPAAPPSLSLPGYFCPLLSLLTVLYCTVLYCTVLHCTVLLSPLVTGAHQLSSTEISHLVRTLWWGRGRDWPGNKELLSSRVPSNHLFTRFVSANSLVYYTIVLTHPRCRGRIASEDNTWHTSLWLYTLE